jgi:parallel beta-helix repeat protein
MPARPYTDWRPLFLLSAAMLLRPGWAAGLEPTRPGLPEVHVGIDAGDIRGNDHRALQAAVDYVAGLGGGTVSVGPGRYQMRNALTLRANVRVVGVPGQTVLAACDGFRSRLAADGDCNERQITVADPAGFRVGDGVAIDDKSGGGFSTTTATITARVGPNSFRLSAPLYMDYMVSNQAAAALAFPVVGGWHVKNAAVEGLTIDGNRGKSEHLNGCRGGGIYLFECEAVTIRNCSVRNYKGDGISFQVSQHVTVEDCLVENNGGLGLHPGSGSQHPVLRRNRAVGNGQDGLFVCWRVKYGVFEHNEIRGNTRFGISIGHKDTDNLFRNNTIVGNGNAGVFFRNEAEAMGAHRNIFEGNQILDNGAAAKGDAARASVVLRGCHNDVIFRGNTIGHSGPAAGTGLLVSKLVKGLKSEANKFTNVKQEKASREP